jgi:5-methylcytosine-specific restriction endonuclease McrA
MPAVAIEYLTEQFGGHCAYCEAEATTWDHVIPIVNGGATVPGNVVPACLSCNSSKKDSEVFVWLVRTGRMPSPHLIDVLILEVV